MKNFNLQIKEICLGSYNPVDRVPKQILWTDEIKPAYICNDGGVYKGPSYLYAVHGVRWITRKPSFFRRRWSGILPT